MQSIVCKKAVICKGHGDGEVVICEEKIEYLPMDPKWAHFYDSAARDRVRHQFWLFTRCLHLPKEVALHVISFSSSGYKRKTFLPYIMHDDEISSLRALRPPEWESYLQSVSWEEQAFIRELLKQFLCS